MLTVADRIALHVDFLSFGTNDLTQTAIGLSRDDVEAKFLGATSPTGSSTAARSRRSDEPGVGELVAGTKRGREGKPGLKIGVCGEHGDPDSVAFFDRLGLDYVSCSPYRVPIARVAAAQSAAAPEPNPDPTARFSDGHRGDRNLRGPGPLLGGRVPVGSGDPPYPALRDEPEPGTVQCGRPSSATATGSCTRRRSGG